ncbi:hypothetical protein C8F04DRAFT_1255786 [Mycena alexandri]|uniref:SET domain-containing protein n=1 Tax=Mycena alexandri TaxID=1745969 RepID=A0AAD6T2E4_9AGAR|nr:hypothetical protein C8F04DRAFT_1255786 [Mycena alexandri]
MADHGPDAESFKMNRETAKGVYLQVREEFLAWKDKMVVEEFNRLSNATSTPSPFSFAAHAFRMPRAAFAPLPTPTPKVEDREVDTEFISEWNYDADGKPDAGRAIPMKVVPLPDTFVDYPPHPPYQYCTPASRNENARMIDNKQALFLPFADDPMFPRDTYFKAFDEEAQWVSNQKDPDGKYHLSFSPRCNRLTDLIFCPQRRFSAALIDEIIRATPGLTPLRFSNESGLLWAVSQRDLPLVIWGDGLPSSSKPQLPPHFAQDYGGSKDLFKQVNAGLSKFCPNLNCITHNCHVHVDSDWSLFTPPVGQVQPHLTSTQLLAAAQGPHPACSKECFRLIGEDDMEEDGPANVPLPDLAILDSLLKLIPDAIPCELAVVSKITCRNVFVYRREKIKDAIISAGKQPRKGKQASRLNKKAKKYDYENQHLCHVSTQGVALTPFASAFGASYTANGIAVVQKNTYFPDDAPPAAVGGKCTNVVLQRGTFKNIVVMKSKYGLGAFAGEDISVGDVVGEYVGELLDNSNETLGHREVIQDHSKLNYVRPLFFCDKYVLSVKSALGWGGVDADETGKGGEPDQTTVDAQWLGNPTRFLNDSKPNKPNCVADEVRVNGECRLLIRAVKPVKMGCELTLSYGDRYWKTGQETDKGGSGPASKSGGRRRRNEHKQVYIV